MKWRVNRNSKIYSKQQQNYEKEFLFTKKKIIVFFFKTFFIAFEIIKYEINSQRVEKKLNLYGFIAIFYVTYYESTANDTKAYVSFNWVNQFKFKEVGAI